MAKFKLEATIGQLNWNPAGFGVPVLDSFDTSRIELTGSSGDRLVLTGKGFAMDGDLPRKGTIETVEFFTGTGETLLTITDAHFKFAELPISDIQDSFNLFEAGKDIIKGSPTGDVILYGTNEGNDTIRAMGGNDVIFGSPGSNTIDGGGGQRDILSYAVDTGRAIRNGVKVDLDAGTATNPWGKTDTIRNIEEIRGTHFNDRIIGSRANEFFLGHEGKDRLTGGKGSDEFAFFAGNGKDRITDFGNGNDTVLLGGFEGISSFADVEPLLEQKGGNVVLNLGNGDAITVVDIRKEELTVDDFSFLL